MEDILLCRWEDIVKNSGNNVAIIDGNNMYSYLDVNNKIKQYIKLIKDNDVTENTGIGIYMKASLDYWAAVMATLYCNCFFVPIDTALPDERVVQMLNLSNTSNIVTNEDNIGLKFDNCNAIKNNHSAILEKDVDIAGNIDCDLAYILFTSGTSGVPKGVIISREGLYNLVNWYGNKYSVNNQTRILQLSNISFDVSIEEFFGTLLNGGIVVISDDKCKYHRKWFSDIVDKYNITMIQMIPRMAKDLICEYDKLNSLDIIILGAEQLTEDVKNKVLSAGYRLYNHYGPTECTVDALTSECKLDEEVNIGYPIDNTKCYIVDDNDCVIDEVNTIGELVVEGPGVAWGYINNSEETNKSFIATDKKNIKAYKTGDIVLKNDKGQFVYKERKDNQIKINGQRIEIEEINNQVMRIEGVKDCITLVINEGNNKVITLFWCGEADENSIESHLKKLLPVYMIPVAYLKVDKMPTTVNDKIDKNALNELYMQYKEEKKGETGNKLDVDGTLERILEIIGSVMEISTSDLAEKMDLSLEQLGMDSMAYMQIIVLVEEEYDVELGDDFLLASEFDNLADLVMSIKSNV